MSAREAHEYGISRVPNDLVRDLHAALMNLQVGPLSEADYRAMDVSACDLRDDALRTLASLV